MVWIGLSVCFSSCILIFCVSVSCSFIGVFLYIIAMSMSFGLFVFVDDPCWIMSIIFVLGYSSSGFVCHSLYIFFYCLCEFFVHYFLVAVLVVWEVFV